MNRADVAPEGTLIVYTYPGCDLEGLRSRYSSREYTLPPTGDCVDTPPSLIERFLSFQATTSAPVPASLQCDFTVFSGAGCTGNSKVYIYPPEIDFECQTELVFESGSTVTLGGKSAEFNCSTI